MIPGYENTPGRSEQRGDDSKYQNTDDDDAYYYEKISIREGEVSTNLLNAANKALGRTNQQPRSTGKVSDDHSGKIARTTKLFGTKLSPTIQIKFLIAIVAVLLSVIIGLCVIVFRLQHTFGLTVTNQTTALVQDDFGASAEHPVKAIQPVIISDPDILSIGDPLPKYATLYEAFSSRDAMVVFYNEGIDFWKSLRNGKLVRTSTCNVTTLPKVQVAIVPNSERIIYSTSKKSSTFVMYDLGNCEQILAKDVGNVIFHIRNAENHFIVTSKSIFGYITQVYTHSGNLLDEFNSYEYISYPNIAPNGLVGCRIKEDRNIGLYDSLTNSVLDPLPVDFNFFILHFARNGTVAVIQEANREHYAVYDIPNRKLLHKGGQLKNDVFMPPNAVSEDGRNILFVITSVDYHKRRVENFVQVVRLDQSLTQIQFLSELSFPLVPHWSIAFRKIGGVDHIQAVTEVTGQLKMWKVDEKQETWIEI